MATAKKLPSGNWRIRPFDVVTGKTVSFTAPTKKEAELMAVEYLNGLRAKAKSEKTIEECIDSYIESKSHILSPSSIDKYKRNKKYFEPLYERHPSDLQQDELQRFFNELSIKLQPKTVCDLNGFLTGILNVYAPNIHFKIALPKKIKKIKQLPAPEEIMKIIKDTEIELPCLLALWCGMRKSEIRGARKKDIKNNILTIQNIIIDTSDGAVEKTQTKTYDSTRQIPLPDYIMQLVNNLPEEQEYLTTLSGQALYKRFVRLANASGISGITFHDLRHINASTMLMLGVPDKYAMERGGWSSNNIMKSVYQHTFSEQRKNFDNLINEYFSKISDNICHET